MVNLRVSKCTNDSNVDTPPHEGSRSVGRETVEVLTLGAAEHFCGVINGEWTEGPGHNCDQVGHVDSVSGSGSAGVAPFRASGKKGRGI